MFTYSPMIYISRIIALLLAITVHECSHGFAAYKLGDPTAKYQGRLTLNPLAHLDPIGALCMLLFRFGWAKPVPINPMYFRDRKQGTAITAAAGPLANIALSLISALLLAPFMVFIVPHFNNFLTNFIVVFFHEFAYLNIYFAAFNIIPLPPLDGSKILGAFLSHENYARLLQYERYAFPILIILMVTHVIDKVLYIITAPLTGLWSALYTLLINILS